MVGTPAPAGSIAALHRPAGLSHVRWIHSSARLKLHLLRELLTGSGAGAVGVSCLHRRIVPSWSLQQPQTTKPPISTFNRPAVFVSSNPFKDAILIGDIEVSRSTDDETAHRPQPQENSPPEPPARRPTYTRNKTPTNLPPTMVRPPALPTDGRASAAPLGLFPLPLSLSPS